VSDHFVYTHSVMYTYFKNRWMPHLFTSDIFSFLDVGLFKFLYRWICAWLAQIILGGSYSWHFTLLNLLIYWYTIIFIKLLIYIIQLYNFFCLASYKFYMFYNHLQCVFYVKGEISVHDLQSFLIFCSCVVAWWWLDLRAEASRQITFTISFL
jgi:hypothetical protein